MELAPNGLALLVVFFVADLVYTVDHYLVHRDRERYRAGHGRHHRRYNRARAEAEPQLDGYELATYSSAGVFLFAVASVLALVTGVWGFAAGALLKYVHSLVFHLYQHRWWGAVHLRKQALPAPRPHWGVASARYHAWHHSHPDDGPFTYAETWAGFDRLLERAHPWLETLTADARRARPADEVAP